MLRLVLLALILIPNITFGQSDWQDVSVGTGLTPHSSVSSDSIFLQWYTGVSGVISEIEFMRSRFFSPTSYSFSGAVIQVCREGNYTRASSTANPACTSSETYTLTGFPSPLSVPSTGTCTATQVTLNYGTSTPPSLGVNDYFQIRVNYANGGSPMYGCTYDNNPFPKTSFAGSWGVRDSHLRIKSTGFVSGINTSNLFNTKFTNVSGITYSTSTQTFNFSVSQFIDILEIVRSNPNRNIENHRVTYSLPGSSNFTTQSFNFSQVDGNSTTSIGVNDSGFGVAGTYTFLVSFGNTGSALTEIIPFAETYVYFDVTLNASGTVTSTQVDTPYVPLPVTSTSVLNCSVTRLDDCLVIGGLKLFSPSSETVTKVFGLDDNLSTRAPFVYVYQMGDLIETLYTSSSTASTSISIDFAGLGELDLISIGQLQAVPFTAWLRTFLGTLMWIMFGWVVYRRTLKIFNPSV